MFVECALDRTESPGKAGIRVMSRTEGARYLRLELRLRSRPAITWFPIRMITLVAPDGSACAAMCPVVERIDRPQRRLHARRRPYAPHLPRSRQPTNDLGSRKVALPATLKAVGHDVRRVPHSDSGEC